MATVDDAISVERLFEPESGDFVFLVHCRICRTVAGVVCVRPTTDSPERTVAVHLDHLATCAHYEAFRARHAPDEAALHP